MMMTLKVMAKIKKMAMTLMVTMIRRKRKRKVKREVIRKCLSVLTANHKSANSSEIIIIT